MSATQQLSKIPALRELLDGADHVDVKSAEADLTLREFLTALMDWQPAWAAALFRLRPVLARALRLDTPDVPKAARLAPEDLELVAGGRVGFFTVAAAEEDRYVVLEAADNHLTGYLGVVAEPMTNGRNRFHVLTIVRYRRWTGPVYFNVIRPFHHLIVGRMVKAAAT